jgi:hypothetical protein
MLAIQHSNVVSHDVHGWKKWSYLIITTQKKKKRNCYVVEEIGIMPEKKLTLKQFNDFVC